MLQGNSYHWFLQSFKKNMYCVLIEDTLLGTVDKIYSKGL